MNSSTTAHTVAGLLGDTTSRNYVRNLALFNAFAQPELTALIASLGLQPGMAVLDAGCGTGEALQWLQQAVGPQGLVVGVDLATDHARAARETAPAAAVLQANIAGPPLRAARFDLVWCLNTIHHLHDPMAGVDALRGLLKPGGRLALLQSSLLPEMLFAWDSHLENRVNEAVRSYYQQRYDIPPRRLAGVRSVLGLARRALLRNVTAKSVLIERVAPLSSADRAYFTEVLFHGTWDQRLQPHLNGTDYASLRSLCDPRSPAFALDRPDFHYLQSLTLVTATA